MSDKEFPISVLEVIKKEMGHNASIRTISALIPFENVRFGRDCIMLHNDILKKIYKKPKMKLGSQIVGKDSTHEILQKQGLASSLKVFKFLNKEGKKSVGNASAWDIKDSVGKYIKLNYKGPGVSIYGISAMDGYHSMLLTYRTIDGAAEFTLLDQGPATSALTGRSVYYTAGDLDADLEKYVRDRADKRTRGGYEYPANIQIYRIYPSENK